MDDRDDAAFLRTIRSVPDRDTPRLVYADYLEEAGHAERAEFIRLQCDLAQTSASAGRYAALKAREQELLALHQTEWRNQLPMLRGVHWETFERGFVASVRIDDPHLFFRHATEIFDAAPVQRLNLHGFFAPEARRLALLGEMSRVRVLDLNDGNRIGNVGLEALADSRYLMELRELRVRHNAIAQAGVRALAGSPVAERLNVLDLHSNQIFDEGTQWLAESARLTNLTVLDLDWTRAGTHGAAALAASPHLIHLHSLYLTGNDIGDEGTVALAGAAHHAKLQVLYLANNRIGDAGASALAASPFLDSHARCLYLRNNRIGDVGALALARSPYLGEVRELILGDNLIGDEAGQVLRRRFGRRVWLW